MPKALVIDDDEAVAEQLVNQACSAVIGDSPLDFIFAGTDDEALQIMRDVTDIDLALVSVESENISGMGLFKKMQGVQLRVPRIAIIGSGKLDIVRGAMTEGAADFLVKPLESNDVVETCRRVYAQTERRRNAWKTEAQLAAIRKELDIAVHMQQSILPSHFPDVEAYSIAAEVRPARDMSGDFYDFFELDDGRLFLVVADVSGKGVPAAFYMAVARTLVRAIALSGGQLKDCLAQVNTALCRHDIFGMFVSVFLAEIDTTTWQITYANGGHLPPVLKNGVTGTAEFLTDGGDGVVLGVQEPMVYSQGQYQLEPGDCLLFYTDGVTEAFNADRVQFSPERLRDHVAEQPGGLHATEMTRGLFQAIDTFVGRASQSDDITVLSFHRHKDPKKY